jgi:hypothetical protein
MPPRAVRAGVLALAVLACAWFVVGIRQARDVTRATAILSARVPVDAARAARVSTLVRGAKLLSPDPAVDLLSAQLAIRRGDRPRARRIAEGVVRAEPMNVQAWLWLAKASSDSPPTFVRALVHINALEPPVHRKR